MIQLTCASPGCAGGAEEHEYTLSEYEGARARWCPGCGDHSVLTAVQRLLTSEQLVPEQTVFVSGIGCSSRFPHYLRTYGFHGIHGRALPVATGIKLHRPDLTVFVVMGDGDCTSIGAAHWIHALRYNPDLTVLMLVLDLFIANAPAEVRKDHMERAKNGTADLDRDLAKLRSLMGHRYDEIRDNLPELLERYGDLRDPRAVKSLLARLRIRRGAAAGDEAVASHTAPSDEEWQLQVAAGRGEPKLN